MRSGMKQAAVLFILCIFFCGICPCSALGLTEAEISSSEEWVWEAGSVNSFQGNVTADQDYQDAVLTLSVESGLENSGEALFMVVNGKKLKIRKRSSSITEDLSAGEALSFEGGWYLPETLEETVSQAEITLRVQDSSGREIAVSTLKAGTGAEEVQSGEPAVARMNLLILILFVCAGAVWLLAIGRHLFLRQRSRKAV